MSKKNIVVDSYCQTWCITYQINRVTTTVFSVKLLQYILEGE